MKNLNGTMEHMLFRIKKRLGPHNHLRMYVNKLLVKIKFYL